MFPYILFSPYDNLIIRMYGLLNHSCFYQYNHNFISLYFCTFLRFHISLLIPEYELGGHFYFFISLFQFKMLKSCFIFLLKAFMISNHNIFKVHSTLKLMFLPEGGQDGRVVKSWAHLLPLITKRDGMGREEGGGFRMGNTCIPVVDSFWYLAKLIQLCKV